MVSLCSIHSVIVLGQTTDDADQLVINELFGGPMPSMLHQAFQRGIECGVEQAVELGDDGPRRGEYRSIF